MFSHCMLLYVSARVFSPIFCFSLNAYIWITDFSMQLSDNRSKSSICFILHSSPKLALLLLFYGVFFFLPLLAFVWFATKAVSSVRYKSTLQIFNQSQNKVAQTRKLIMELNVMTSYEKNKSKIKKRKKKQMPTKRISFFRVPHLRTNIAFVLNWAELNWTDSRVFSSFLRLNWFQVLGKWKTDFTILSLDVRHWAFSIQHSAFVIMNCTQSIVILHIHRLKGEKKLKQLNEYIATRFMVWILDLFNQKLTNKRFKWLQTTLIPFSIRFSMAILNRIISFL